MKENHNKLSHKIAVNLLCEGYVVWGMADTFLPDYGGSRVIWPEVKCSFNLARRVADGKRIPFSKVSGLYRKVKWDGEQNVPLGGALLVSNELLHGPGREFGAPIEVSAVLEKLRSLSGLSTEVCSPSWIQAGEGETGFSRVTSSIVANRMKSVFGTVHVNRPGAFSKNGTVLGERNALKIANKKIKEGGVVAIHPEGHKGHWGVGDKVAPADPRAVSFINHFLRLKERHLLDFDLHPVGVGILEDGTLKINFGEKLEVKPQDNVSSEVMRALNLLVPEKYKSHT